MIDICCVGSGVKFQTRAVVFARNKQTTISRGMEAAGSTPTKSFSRIALTPKSKNSICLQCGDFVDNADKRRKLFDGGEKTQICNNFDRIFALSSRDSCAKIVYFSNIICRNCSDKNITLLKKVDLTQKTIVDTQDRLTKERGETVTKRGPSSEIGETTASATNTGGRAKRRVALFPEVINDPANPPDRSKVKDQGTQTEQESSLASVSVSFLPNLYLVKIVRLEKPLRKCV